MKIPIRRLSGFAMSVVAGFAILCCGKAFALPSVHNDFWDTTRRVEPVPNQGVGAPMAAAFDSGVTTFGPSLLEIDFSSFISTLKDGVMSGRFRSTEPSGILIFIK